MQDKIACVNGRIYFVDQPDDVLYYRAGSGDTLEIFDIRVMSERSQGRGTKLIERLVEEVKGKTHLIFAITRQSNTPAIRFYERNGFKQMALLPDFYEDENAIMVGRRL